jgi:Tol biopolymer transport system component
MGRTWLTAMVATAFVLALPLGASATPSSITIRTSVATNGNEGNNMSGRFSRPAISDNARFTAFDSLARNLVPNDTNRRADIFVHDAVTGVTERVSVSTAGGQANRDSSNPSISADGRFVAFDSTAGNLTPGDTNQIADVFVHDRQSGLTVRASRAAGGGAGNLSSFYPSISNDGRAVAFVSDASNLIPGGTNGQRHIFVRDFTTRTTEVVSVSSNETEGNSSSATPSISADGTRVAFATFATNLVPGDSNGLFDVFVRDRAAGTTVIASLATNGIQGDDDSTLPAISGSGMFVAFASDATNLVAADTNGTRDVLLRDLAAATTIRVSLATDESQSNGQSVGPGVRGGLAFGPAVNFDGTTVAFDSIASNLVAGDTNSCPPNFQTPGRCPDIYVRDWVAGTTIRVSVASNGAQSNDASTDPAIDASGRAVAFFSAASNLVAGDTNLCIQFPTVGHCPDIFVHIEP